METVKSCFLPKTGSVTTTSSSSSIVNPAHTTGDADASIYGSTSSGYLGYSTAVGDLDGDDVPDIVTAAPYNGTRGNGAAYVFFASDL